MTLQASDVTDEPVTWTRLHEWGKFINGWMETGATHLVHPLLVRFPQITPYFTWFAANSLKAGTHVMSQSDNMLLGDWINSMVPSLNASVSFPPGAACEWVREAWYMVVDLVEDFFKQGMYPANLAMNTRLLGKARPRCTVCRGPRTRPPAIFRSPALPTSTGRPARIA